MTTKERIAKALAVATDTKVFEMESNILHLAPSIFKEQFGDAKAIVIADKNTWRVAGEEVYKHLVDAGIEVSKHIIQQDEFHAEWCYVMEVEEAAKEAGAIMVSVGSGVINDLCKYVSHKHDLYYYIVATAPSMDGYASDGAAMITGGMKVTYKAGLPRAIIADTEVLCNAPIDMLKAGYGDIIGKFSALNDWKLSNCVNGEYFCQYIYDLTLEQIDTTLRLANGILERREESIKALMEALVIIGIMMSFAGSSRPASGSEHHLSHFFEITGIITNSQYLAHGLDVAYSTVVTAEIRENILANRFPSKIYRPDEAQHLQKMEEIYIRKIRKVEEDKNTVFLNDKEDYKRRK